MSKAILFEKENNPLLKNRFFSSTVIQKHNKTKRRIVLIEPQFE